MNTIVETLELWKLVNNKIFNLNTSLWTTPIVKKKKTLPNNPPLPKQNIYYSNNIDFLVTIYSTQFKGYLVYDSSASHNLIKYVNLFFCVTFSYLFYKFLLFLRIVLIKNYNIKTFKIKYSFKCINLFVIITRLKEFY